MSDIRLAAEVVAEVKKAVVGKDDILVKALLAVLARGRILLEDIPGGGKATMAVLSTHPTLPPSDTAEI